jgi:hypothetical protein
MRAACQPRRGRRCCHLGLWRVLWRLRHHVPRGYRGRTRCSVSIMPRHGSSRHAHARHAHAALATHGSLRGHAHWLHTHGLHTHRLPHWWRRRRLRDGWSSRRSRHGRHARDATGQGRCRCKHGVWPAVVHGGYLVLLRHEAFGRRAMTLVGVLLESILNGDSPIHEELAMHCLNRSVRGLKGVKADKAETF